MVLEVGLIAPVSTKGHSRGQTQDPGSQESRTGVRFANETNIDNKRRALCGCSSPKYIYIITEALGLCTPTNQYLLALLVVLGVEKRHTFFANHTP